MHKLFSSPEGQAAIATFQNWLRTTGYLDAVSKSKKAQLLTQALQIFSSNAALVDERCQVNIEIIGRKLLEELGGLPTAAVMTSMLDTLYSMVFRFANELDLSMQGELAPELREVISYGFENRSEFDTSAQAHMSWVEHQMPIWIVKKLVGSEVLANIQNFNTFKDQFDARLARWSSDLESRESKVDNLKATLEKYETAFNFVGLYKGFDVLSRAKRLEMRSLRKWTVAFGVLSVIPIIVELGVIYWNIAKLDEIKWALGVSAIPALSLAILLIYFFRIFLRNADSAKSQLTQIELRKTLCRFIQSYAKFSQELKTQNIDALSKFENVIFSGIVASDEKMPSTFDGMEQISSLVKSLKN